jgi:hypothetical protein
MESFAYYFRFFLRVPDIPDFPDTLYPARRPNIGPEDERRSCYFIQ